MGNRLMKKQYKLKDIGAFKGGVTSIKPTDYGYGTPFITYKNIFQNPKVDINMLTLMNVPKKDLQKCSCKYGDIFFTASSEVFEEVAMSSVLLDKGIKNLTFNGFSKRFRLFDFNTLLPEYAVYYFRSREFRNSIAAITTGDIRFNVSQENLSNITITLPPLSEQKRIANILSSFDNKIEILKKENKILEDIAENIFKEWFVKYNFPNKDGKPYRDSNGKMIDSELGPIPDGWRVRPLTEIAEFLNGLAMQKYRPKLGEESLPVIKIREMNNGFTKDTDRASKNIDSKYIVNNGDIIFSWSGTIDITIWKHGQGALNQHLFKVSSNKYPKWFYYFWIKHYLNEYKQIASEKATTMGHIQRKHLEESLVAVPDKEVVDLDWYIDKIIVNNDLTDNLIKSKNNLLKKLIK